jgi:hypothetical protein
MSDITCARHIVFPLRGEYEVVRYVGGTRKSRLSRRGVKS